MATPQGPTNPLQFFGPVSGLPTCGTNEHVVIALAIQNNAGKIVFPSYAWDGTPPAAGEFAWYTCLSTSSSIPDGDWRVSRAESHMAWSYVLAADDIGTKVARSTIRATLPKPTVEIETSPGNFQFLWGLAHPANPVHLRAALAWLADRELTDPGCLGANRLIRVPGSCNAKPETLAKNAGKPFHARTAAFHPERRYVLSELAKIDITSHAHHPAKPFDRELATHDMVYRWLCARQLVFSRPTGDGWIDIRCPWAHLHSDRADDLAGWRIGRPGRFHCFHAHGAQHRTPQFMAWLYAQE